MNVKKISLLIFILLISSQLASGLVISPSELKINNAQIDKNYQFLILLTSQDSGLRSYELKTTSQFVDITPNRFMLNKDERKNIKLNFNLPSDSNLNEGYVVIQPYVNNIPSDEKIKIYYNTEGDTNINSFQEISSGDTKLNEISNSDKIQNMIFIAIYALIVLIAVLIIIFIYPDLKKLYNKYISKNKKQIANKNIKIKNKSKNKSKNKKLKIDLFNKKTNINPKLEKRLLELEETTERTNKKIQHLTQEIELFVDGADDWLRKNSGDKYGLN